jgi:hypothetical protein
MVKERLGQKKDLGWPQRGRRRRILEPVRGVGYEPSLYEKSQSKDANNAIVLSQRRVDAPKVDLRTSQNTQHHSLSTRMDLSPFRVRPTDGEWD